jgi:ribonuclease BN (tRNA processing enzyme)
MDKGLNLTFLGSGNAFTPGGRYWSSFLVNGRYLFDAPPTLLPHLKRLSIRPEDLQTIFITHFHGDHFLGLPFLFLEYMYSAQRNDDLIIVGPPGVQERAERLADLAYPSLVRDAGYRRIYTEAQPGEKQQAGDLAFDALPVNHAHDRLQCYGYRVQIGEHIVAYTGDTMYCPEILDLARGADVLVVDSTYLTNGPEHMGLVDVRRLRSEVDAKTAIVLTHLEAEPDVSPDEGLIVAHDFETFTFLR